MDITTLMKQRAKEERKTPAESLTAKIEQFISGAMPASEMDTFSRTHGKEIDAEINRRRAEFARQSKAKRDEIEDYATKIWRGQQSAENCYSEQRAFMHDFPQLVGCVENIDAIATALRSRNLVPHYNNLVQVFTELIHRGELLISPAAIEVGEEETVTGENLRRHPNLKLLLQPAQERERHRIASQSAEEYKKEHIEDWPQSIPPMILQRIGRVLDTFSAAHPEYVHSTRNKDKIVAALTKDGTQITIQSIEGIYRDLAAREELELGEAMRQGEVVTMIDFGGHQPGYSPQPSKYSLRKKLESMSATEITERCAKDPAFKAALDNL